MSLALFFGLCILISSIFIRFGILLSGYFGVLDHPGGHKQHDTSTPFVGGFGVIAVVLSTLYLGATYFPELSQRPMQAIALGTVVLFVTGFADDIWHLNFKTRFVIQALVAVSMVFLGGVELVSLGELIPGVDIDLGALGIPFTIFATIGLINALNMIDGIDGLSGSLSFISLGFAALVALLAQDNTYLVFIIAVMGGVSGFLYFNLRYPSNGRARVFLGDNGSMLLGFVFAWILIALSQGEHRAMTPVTALWIFGVPLLDTVSVMLRRIWVGKSPFHADRNHLHHLFLRAGFRVSDTVWTVALLQLILGTIGVIGLHLALPESLMFGLFIVVFCLYFYVIARPWRFVPNLRRLNIALGLPSVHAKGVFVGYFKDEQSQEVLDALIEELGQQYDYRLSLHQIERKLPNSANIYALIELEGSVDEISVGEIRRLMLQIKAHFASSVSLQVRLFMHRSKDNDRRLESNKEGERVENCIRDSDRRAAQGSSAFYTTVTDGENKESSVVQV